MGFYSAYPAAPDNIHPPVDLVGIPNDITHCNRDGVWEDIGVL